MSGITYWLLGKKTSGVLFFYPDILDFPKSSMFWNQWHDQDVNAFLLKLYFLIPVQASYTQEFILVGTVTRIWEKILGKLTWMQQKYLNVYKWKYLFPVLIQKDLEQLILKGQSSHLSSIYQSNVLLEMQLLAQVILLKEDLRNLCSMTVESKGKYTSSKL